MFIALMREWDPSINCIRIGGKSLRMTAGDLSVILGINCYGTTVCLDDRRPSATLKKWSEKRNVSDVDRDFLENLLFELAPKTDNISVRMFVRAFILMVFSSFLFPTKNFRTLKSLFVYVDRLGEFTTYGWGQAVYDYIIQSINASRRNILECLRTTPPTVFHMPGCVIAVLAWLYERIPSISPRVDMTKSPRLFRHVRPARPITITEATRLLKAKTSQVIRILTIA
jgi:hypothetical protein